MRPSIAIIELRILIFLISKTRWTCGAEWFEKLCKIELGILRKLHNFRYEIRTIFAMSGNNKAFLKNFENLFLFLFFTNFLYAISQMHAIINLISLLSTIYRFSNLFYHIII